MKAYDTGDGSRFQVSLMPRSFYFKCFHLIKFASFEE